MDNTNENKLDDLQNELLRLYGILADFCDKKKIRYYGCGGTALGAIRHDGFIPWDDDMDIAIPRKDYEILISEESNKLFDKGISAKFDKELLFSRFMDTTVRCSRGDSEWNELFPYLYIDVFPIDGTPNNGLLRMIHFYRIMFIFTVLKLKRIKYLQKIEYMKNRRHRPFIERVVIKYGHLISPIIDRLDEDKLVKKYNKLCCKYDYDNSKVVCVYSGRYRKRELIPKEMIGKGKMHQFSGCEIPIYEKAEEYVKQIYGQNYMELPPISDREKHGDVEIIR